jgi:hypothetical protein
MSCAQKSRSGNHVPRDAAGVGGLGAIHFLHGGFERLGHLGQLRHAFHVVVHVGGRLARRR